MGLINYHNKRFVSIENTSNGEVSIKTFFDYRQEGQIVTATYSGGQIIQGMLIGLVKVDGSLEFRYNHVNRNNELRGGLCRSTPEILPDGRIRLHENWTWMDIERTAGSSIVEEVIHELDY